MASSQETAAVDNYRRDEVYYDRSFHPQNLRVSQQCEDDQYGFNAIMVIGDSSFPIRRCHPFHFPAWISASRGLTVDPRPLPEPHNDVTLNQSETDSEDAGVMGALSQLSSPPVAPPLRARVGGLATTRRSSSPINGVEPLGVSMETWQALESLHPMGSDEEEGGRGKRKTRRKKSKKRHRRGQRRISC